MQPIPSDASIAVFETGHIDPSVALSQAEGWPHRPQDWALLHAISDGVVALVDDRVVGTAFCTPFADTLATFNMIIVAHAQRGRGLGTRLMQALLALAGPRAVRLVATEAGYPLYRRMGFTQTGRILQQQGVVAMRDAPGAVDAAGEQDHDAIKALDKRCTGLDRTALWDALLAVSSVKVLRDGGAVSAVAACRDFGRGKVVGPVLAASAEDAKRLISAHLAAHAGTFVRIDVPAESGLAPWLEELGLANVGGGRVMLRGRAPSADQPGIYALASQAVG